MGRTKQQKLAELERFARPELEELQLELFAEARQALINKSAKDAQSATEIANKAEREEEHLVENSKLREKEEKEVAALTQRNEEIAERKHSMEAQHKAKLAQDVKKAKEAGKRKREDMEQLSRQHAIWEAERRERHRNNTAKKREREEEEQRQVQQAQQAEIAPKSALMIEERALENKSEAETLAGIDSDSLFGCDDSADDMGLCALAEDIVYPNNLSSDESIDEMSSLFGDDCDDDTGLSSRAESMASKDTQEKHEEVILSSAFTQPYFSTKSSPTQHINNEGDEIEALLLADLEAEEAAERELSEVPSISQPSVNTMGVNITTDQATNDLMPRSKLVEGLLRSTAEAPASVNSFVERQQEWIGELNVTGNLESLLPRISASLLPARASLPVAATVSPASTVTYQTQTANPPLATVHFANPIVAKYKIYELPGGSLLSSKDLQTFTPKQQAAFKAKHIVTNIRSTPDRQFELYKLSYKSPAQSNKSPASNPPVEKAYNITRQYPNITHASSQQTTEMMRQYVQAKPQNSIVRDRVDDQGQPQPSLTAAQHPETNQKLQDKSTGCLKRKLQYETQSQASEVGISTPIIDLTTDSTPKDYKTLGMPDFSNGAHNTMQSHLDNYQHTGFSTPECVHGPMFNDMMQPELQSFDSTYSASSQTFGTQNRRLPQQQAFHTLSATPQHYSTAVTFYSAPKSSLLPQHSPISYNWQQPAQSNSQCTILNHGSEFKSEPIRKQVPESTVSASSISPAKKQRMTGAPHFTSTTQSLFLDSTHCQPTLYYVSHHDITQSTPPGSMLGRMEPAYQSIAGSQVPAAIARQPLPTSAGHQFKWELPTAYDPNPRNC